MRKAIIGFVSAFVVAFASLVYAQVIGAPNRQLVWDQPGVANQAAGQALTYTYYADGATTGTPLTGVTCANGTPVVCRAPFPAFTPGAHSLTLSASNAAGESAKSTVLSFTFVVVPNTPTNIRIE